MTDHPAIVDFLHDLLAAYRLLNEANVRAYSLEEAAKAHSNLRLMSMFADATLDVEDAELRRSIEVLQGFSRQTCAKAAPAIQRLIARNRVDLLAADLQLYSETMWECHQQFIGILRSASRLIHDDLVRQCEVLFN